MYSYRDDYLDLDPTYKDRFGRPLLRMTIDFHDNELQDCGLPHRQARRDRQGDGRAKQIDKKPRKGPYDVTKYQTTHSTAAPSWAPIRKTSALNRYLQSWDVPNLFVTGASAFPQNAGYNPTGTVGALAYWAATAIRKQYLKNPGPLVACVGADLQRSLCRAASPAATRAARRSRAAAPISKTSPQIERGRYLATAADCVACHTVPTAASRSPAAGRSRRRSASSCRPTSRPTARPASAPGATTQFDKAVRKGIRRDGGRLYPAMPYPSYTKMSREDVMAIRAYLSTVPAGAQSGASPTRCRSRSIFAPRCASGTGSISSQASSSLTRANRRNGIAAPILVQGPGHCGACHTPKNLLGGDEDSEYLAGRRACRAGSRPTSPMTACTGSAAGRQTTSRAYLKTGHNPHHRRHRPDGGGDRAQLSSQSKTADLEAIATYLKSLPGQDNERGGRCQGRSVMVAGGAIYRDQCSACHGLDGKGVPRLFPSLADSAMVRSKDPTTLVRIVLRGARSVATKDEPTAPGMPSFGWKLDDAQVAAVVSYVRNAWKPAAAPVSKDKVERIRKDVQARVE